LIRSGVAVHIFNQRSIAEILQTIRVLGGMIGCEQRACRLAAQLQVGLTRIAGVAAGFARRPRVYFEEWDVPQISAIRWVSELIGIAGGEDCFPELAREPLGKQRIIADSQEVVRRSPDIIFGSWCGKKFQPKSVAARPGWAQVPAVREGALYEIKSPLILQPGPAALTDGVSALHAHIAAWVRSQDQDVSSRSASR
jgi:iron complex transport system substrate-binding protein